MELLNLKLKKGQVEISSVGLVASEAFILEGERWNGWAIPFFTKEEAIKVLEKVKTLCPFEFYYKVEGDKILILDTTQGSEWEEVEQTTHEGKTLYGVGAWSWTWDEYEEEEKQYLVVYGMYANGYIAETLEKELSASNEKEAEKEAQQIAERLEKENSREDYEITLLIEELRQIDE